MRKFTPTALVLTLPALIACGHDRLDFAFPDGGDAHARGDGAICDGGPSCVEGGEGFDVLDGSTTDGARGDTTGDPHSASPVGTLVMGDPDGYPTMLDQWAPWCEDKASFTELCGNEIDEDCDGWVDEFAGLGGVCMNGCYEGQYVCHVETSTLVCGGPGGCTNEVPPPCGDGLKSYNEECDPASSSEEWGVTCTADCRRPLFVRCVTAGVVDAELCNDLQACNERIGACVPVVGPRQPRCPKLPVEGGADGAVYPMLETEGGECWITCSEPEHCPGLLRECYMGFCAVPF